MTKVGAWCKVRTLALALAGGIGALTCHSGADAQEMAFSLTPLKDPASCGKRCVAVISAVGEIVDETPQVFLDFLKRNVTDPRLRVVVFLHSPGGKVVASMQLGTILRKAGAVTVVARVTAPEPGSGLPAGFQSGRCYSACVYALMGGRKRVVPPQSAAGIHRMFTLVGWRDPAGEQSGPQKRYDSGSLGARLASYASVMGVSRDLVATAESTSSDSIHIVSPNELRRWRLASQKF